jgi:hypothetical protein
MIDQSLLDDPKFKDLFDIVFIDEKWFYLYKKSERYYLLPNEDEPHRSCKNKNYIPRIMFCVLLHGQDLEMEYVCFMAR